MIVKTKTLLPLLLALSIAGCKSKPPPARAKGKTSGSKGEPEKGQSPTLAAPPIAPITLPPLKMDPAPAVVALLSRAHYDADHLGLKDLVFSVKMTTKSKRGKTEVEANCRYRGQEPDVELMRVLRDGKPVQKSKHELNQTIWTSLRFKTRRVINGIGRGFLRDRLEQFKSAEAKVAWIEKPTKALRLIYQDHKAGKTTVIVNEGYRVRRIKNESPLGVTREAIYDHRTVGGRNLVTKIVYTVTIDKKSKVPRKAERMLLSGDGSVTEIHYTKVGRYYLPSKLSRHLPAIDDHLEVIFTYKRARP